MILEACLFVIWVCWLSWDRLYDWECKMLIPVLSGFKSYPNILSGFKSCPNMRLPCSVRTDVELGISLSCSCERFAHIHCVWWQQTGEKLCWMQMLWLSSISFGPWGGMGLGNLDIWVGGVFLWVSHWFRLAEWFIPVCRLLLRLGLCPIPHVWYLVMYGLAISLQRACDGGSCLITALWEDEP